MKNLLKKFRNMPENLKATMVFAIASFATSGINYITTPIFTRLLTTAEYGVVSVYNSWFSIVQVFATVTLINPGILNVGLYDHRDNRWKYLSSMLGITAVSTGVLSVLYILFSKWVNAAFTLPTSLMILMLAMCFLQPATIFWTFKQRYEYSYKITFIVSVGSAILAQLVSIVAVLICDKHGVGSLAEVRLWSAGAVNLIVALVLYIYICSKGKAYVDVPLWGKTLIVAIPLIPHYLSSVLLTSTDKIMISHMLGEDKTGIYSLAAILSAIGVLLWRALSVTYTPFVNAKLGERKFSEIRSAVKPLLLAVGVLCVITSLAAPEILRVLATAEYLEGVYVVPPVAAGIFIHALYDNFTAISFFHKKSVRIMLATVTSAVINIVLNYFCISRFGYIAAGYTTLISNLVLTGMHYINARQIEKEKVYDPKFSLLMVVGVTVACLLCNLLYGFLWIRYILIALLLVFIFLKRKYIISTLISMKV